MQLEIPSNTSPEFWEEVVVKYLQALKDRGFNDIGSLGNLKALHAFAEVFDERSWHSFAAKLHLEDINSPTCDVQSYLYKLKYSDYNINNASGPFETTLYCRTHGEAIDSLYEFVSRSLEREEEIKNAIGLSLSSGSIRMFDPRNATSMGDKQLICFKYFSLRQQKDYISDFSIEDPKNLNNNLWKMFLRNNTALWAAHKITKNENFKFHALPPDYSKKHEFLSEYLKSNLSLDDNDFGQVTLRKDHSRGWYFNFTDNRDMIKMASIIAGEPIKTASEVVSMCADGFHRKIDTEAKEPFHIGISSLESVSKK